MCCNFWNAVLPCFREYLGKEFILLSAKWTLCSPSVAILTLCLAVLYEVYTSILRYIVNSLACCLPDSHLAHSDVSQNVSHFVELTRIALAVQCCHSLNSLQFSLYTCWGCARLLKLEEPCEGSKLYQKITSGLSYHEGSLSRWTEHSSKTSRLDSSPPCSLKVTYPKSEWEILGIKSVYKNNALSRCWNSCEKRTTFLYGMLQNACKRDSG